MIRLIVALDAKRGIAKNGRQPWKLPSDERYFMEQTKLYGGVVVMGRKTFDVIGRPLPDRTNIVLSHQNSLQLPGVTIIHDIKDYLNSLKTDVWVIGGAEVYEQTLGVADELYITEIDSNFDCDQFFPEYAQRFLQTTKGPSCKENGLAFTCNVYSRA